MRDRRLTNEPISTNKGSIDRKMNVLSRCIIKITSLLVGMFSEFFKIKKNFARLRCSANKPSFKEDIDKRKCNLTNRKRNDCFVK